MGGVSTIADDTSILRRKNHLMHDEKNCVDVETLQIPFLKLNIYNSFAAPS